MANPFHLVSICVFLHILSVFANVEKIIFIAAPAAPPPQDASIDNLLLTPFSEQYPSVRTLINASFPTNDSPKGTESWFLLEGLRPQARYEVRICWAATQPTSFWLYTHSVETVFETPQLLASLSAYSYARHDQLSIDEKDSLRSRRVRRAPRAEDSTFLFLQICAAADYFSLNETLMETVPSVAVDVILDPYLLNVLPKTLLPTGLYILVIAVGAWFLSGWIARLSASFTAAQTEEKQKKTK